MTVDANVLAVLEDYYDAAPRPLATAEEVGPFTLFVAADPDGWPYYARPRLGLTAPVSADDVRRVCTRQRELGLPRALEWVHETTPSLLTAAREAGMAVEQCPLLVHASSAAPTTEPVRVRVLDPGSPDLPAVLGAVHAGFSETDVVEPRPAEGCRDLMRKGLLTVAGAYDEHGAVLGGGSHGLRGTTTELTGIAVLPRARRRGLGAAIAHALVEDARARGAATVFLSAQDDAVGRVYERVGFVRVGTACTAEPAEG